MPSGGRTLSSAKSKCPGPLEITRFSNIGWEGESGNRQARTRMDAAEQTVIGMTCCLVGVFFLVNSIIFRKLKNVIATFFGVKMRSLGTIKDYTLNNLQVAFGFVFLAVGFLFQMFAHLQGVNPGRVTMVWVVCASIVVIAVVLFLAGKIYSRHTFKKYVRRFFQAHPEAFNRDINITKEIGEFLGIVHTLDTTVEDYLQKVRDALRMPEDDDDHSQGGGLAPEGGRGRRDLGAFQKR